jgi:Txe/YoeB family toxin of Txe-Axe toxin-antitoxin module
MWHINEHKKIDKTITKLPSQVIKKYELWKDIVYRHGPDKLREFPGFNDEKLKGDRLGQRSSRLNALYRVIYIVENTIVTVFVLEIIPHRY